MQNARRTEMMCTARNVLFRTSTLASSAENAPAFMGGRPFSWEHDEIPPAVLSGRPKQIQRFDPNMISGANGLSQGPARLPSRFLHIRREWFAPLGRVPQADSDRGLCFSDGTDGVNHHAVVRGLEAQRLVVERIEGNLGQNVGG